MFVDGSTSRPPAGPGLSLGVLSATQGDYTRGQFLLDATQGARVAVSLYGSSRPPALALVPAGGGGLVRNWPAALRRADDAPARLQPGLLASAAGGAGYAGIAGADSADGALAADRSGRLAALSLGPAATLLARVQALRRRERLVVTDLPSGGQGASDLRALLRARPSGELLVVLERAADAPAGALGWIGIAGEQAGGTGDLSSATTRERGLVSAVDIAPTVIAHLRARPGTAALTGHAIVKDGPLDAGELERLMARLRAIPQRRLPALGALLGAWVLLLLLAGSRRRRWALSVGSIGVLWSPVVVLAPAALAPGPVAEYTMIAAGCLGLGALCERLLRWPHALIAPAIAAVGILTLDALAHTQLLMRSLLGPDPAGGARFYGIGNELKSGLAVLVLAAVAAALHPSARGHRGAAAFAAAGGALAAVEGAARVGAGVGSVLLVGAGFGLAAALMIADASVRRRTLIALAGVPLALALLVAIDLATAHGAGHFSGSILHAHSWQDLRDIVVRRYATAWGELDSPGMWIALAATVACVLAAALRVRPLLGVAGADPAFRAALAGGLAAGVVGALTEDSGPLLLLVAAVALACVAGYLHAGPTVTAPRRELVPPARASAPTSVPARDLVA